jgi:hypothetical protein
MVRDNQGNQNIQEINSTFKNNMIYSAPGDFDGDKKSEQVCITKFDSKYYISLLESGKLYNSELEFETENFNSIIQDVNNDNKEDLILNVIQDNCENCYVFSFNEGLYIVLSPELITKHIDLEKLEETITYNKKNTVSDKITNSAISYVKLYYTEMDYTKEEPEFISEGVIYTKNQSMYNIRISSKINKSNQVIVSKVEVSP